MSQISLSIIIPLYNERENVKPLYGELKSVLAKLGEEYEIIIVDDGSTDGSLEKLKELKAKDAALRIIYFRRNFGQTAAIQAGFDYAKGKIIITMDADLENAPQDIPNILKKMAEGFDIDRGWRAKCWGGGISEVITRKVPSVLANFLISKVSGVPLHDFGCTLKAYKREVIEEIRLYGDMHRFIPAIACQYGASVAEVKVQFRRRKYGKSKYGFSRTFKVFLDLIVLKFLLGFLTRPIQIFGSIGFIFSGLGIVFGLYLSGLKVFLGENIGGRPLLLLSILLLVLGVQFIMLGILGELMSRTYFESQGKKTYAIREKYF